PSPTASRLTSLPVPPTAPPPPHAALHSRALLERWHGRDRLRYAITPRFAPTCSDAQLTAAGRLAGEYPDALIHTHLAENEGEVDWVATLYPDRQSYLDVYRHFGLLRERAVFAHCLHLDDGDHQMMAAAGGAMAFCPTSNLFLGSGLFDLERARDRGIRVGIGTDIGGGTSFSLLRTLGEAYKVLQLRRQSLSSARGLYLATLGAAEALYMDDAIGNFAPGKEADFIVLDHTATPLIERRIARTRDVGEEFFVQMLLGDDRSVAATYVLGSPANP
ncbi:MAG: guanine deaminase, partial [Pseudomonadota bacterium]